MAKKPKTDIPPSVHTVGEAEATVEFSGFVLLPDGRVAMIGGTPEMREAVAERGRKKEQEGGEEPSEKLYPVEVYAAKRGMTPEAVFALVEAGEIPSVYVPDWGTGERKPWADYRIPESADMPDKEPKKSKKPRTEDVTKKEQTAEQITAVCDEMTKKDKDPTKMSLDEFVNESQLCEQGEIKRSTAYRHRELWKGKR